jgi:hypothetical protein
MITQRLTISQQDIRMTNATRLHALGTVVEDNTGRVWRYSQAGAVNLAAGLATVTPAKVANHTNVAVAVAAAVGSRSVSVTLGATAMTQGQYDGGYLVVNDTPGIGLAYHIAGSSAIASSGTGVVTLEEPIQVALTTSSKVTFTPNPWSNTIVHPGSTSALFCNGDTDIPVAATYFYWSQTGGMTSTLSDGVVAKGTGAILTTNAIAGALITEAAASITQRVAIAVEATVDTKYYPMFLTLE